MTTPSDPDKSESTDRVNLGKSEPPAEEPFDPYRFGKPDHPIPAEYAPPGYTGPVTETPPPAPYTQPSPWAPGYGNQPANPFSNPPGTPYGEHQPYQYPSAPPGPYGPPPPPYHPYIQPKTGNGKAVAALVLGIASIVFFWLSFFDGLFVILGLVFSLIALGETKVPGAGGRGLAIAGLVCTIIGALFAALFTVWVIHVANKCGGLSNTNAPGWEQCFRDNLS